MQHYSEVSYACICIFEVNLHSRTTDMFDQAIFGMLFVCVSVRMHA